MFGFYSPPVNLSSPAAIGDVAPNTVGVTILSLGATPLAKMTSVTADILEIRDGTDPQEVRVYETFTNDANQTHLKIQALKAASYFGIVADYAGTGAQRGVFISSALDFNSILCASSSDNLGIVFATAQTQRWKMNQSGHLVAITDAAYDIGAAGATRPRNIYASAIVKGDLNTNAAATTGLVAGALAALTDSSLVIYANGVAYNVPGKAV